MANKVDTIVRWSPLDISNVLRAHWNSEPKEPVNLIGEPSTVKSEGVLQESKKIAKEENREFMNWNNSSLERKEEAIDNPEKYFVYADLRASETDIGELRLQDMNNDKDYITFKYNILFKALSKDEAKGVLFFDEMNLAPNMIKAQFYKIINDKAVGDIPISDGVLCVSAGNESKHARGVTEDPVPLVLRRGNYFIRPLTAEEYVDYASRTEHHKYIIGYLGFQPNDVHNIKYDIPDSVGQPCPRTWTKLSNILKNNKDIEDDVDSIKMISTGLVGQACAEKLKAFVSAAKQVNIEEIINNPEQITNYENDDDLSLMYAIIAGVVDKFRDDKEVVESAFEMAKHINRDEFGAFLLRSMKNTDEKRFKKIASSDKYVDSGLANDVVKRYGKYLFKDRS